MSFPSKCLLHFEEADGMFCAQLNLEAEYLLLDVPFCTPWIKDGKRGLLYYSYPKHDGIRNEMDAAVRNNPLFSQLSHKLSHWAEMGKGKLCLPRAAAHFARIRDKAELIRLPNGCVLLQSADTAEEAHRAGRLIHLSPDPHRS